MRKFLSQLRLNFARKVRHGVAGEKVKYLEDLTVERITVKRRS